MNRTEGRKEKEKERGRGEERRERMRGIFDIFFFKVPLQ